MKRNKGFMPSIVSFLVASMLLTSCGGSGSTATEGTDAATDTGAETTTSETATEPSGEPVKLVYTSWGGADEKKSMEEVAAKFTEQNPNITIDIQMIATEYDAKLTTMVAANETLDISQLESATIAYPLIEEGKIEALNSYLESDEKVSLDTYVPEALYYNGDDVVGIMSGLEVFHIFYSKAAFDTAGLEYPPTNPEEAWTWDEFVEISKQLTIDQNGNNAASADFDPENIKQYGINMGKWWATWGSFVIANNGDYIAEDGSFGLSKPEAYEAIQKVADLANIHHVAPLPVAEKGMPGMDVALTTGQYAMGIDGAWAALTLGNEEIDYGVAVLPKMEKLVSQSVGGMNSIWSGSEHKAEAWEFMKYLCSPESNLYAYQNGNLMPTINEWYTNPDLVSQWTGNVAHPEGYEEAVIGTMLDYSVSTPTGTIKNFNKIMEYVNPALDAVWLGEATAEDAMKSIEEQVQPLLEGKRH